MKINLDQITKYLIPIILAVAAVFRIVGIFDSSFWYDEALSLRMVDLPIFQMLQLRGATVNPPLWELLIYLPVRLFGSYAARVVSLLASCGSVWLAYILARRYLTKPQLMIFLATIAILSGLALQAQDGRIYAIFGLLYLAGIWFVLRNRHLGLLAVIGLLCYGHASGIFYSAVLAIAAWLRGINWKMRTATLIGYGSYLPWLPVTIQAASSNFWLRGLDLNGFLGAIGQSWFTGNLDPNYLFSATVMILYFLALAAAVLALKFEQNKHLAVIGFVAVGPVVMMLAFSLIWRNVIFYRVLGASVIPMVALMAGTLYPTKIKPSMVLVNLGAIWLATSLTLGLMGWAPEKKGGGMREVCQWINQEIQDHDVVFHATTTSYLPASFYLIQDGSVLDADQPPSLLRREIIDLFGIPMNNPIPAYSTAYVFYSQDSIMSAESRAMMDRIIEGEELIFIVQSWQFAPIHVYRVTEDPPQSMRKTK